jgi:hypothetical protein
MPKPGRACPQAQLGRLTQLTSLSLDALPGLADAHIALLAGLTRWVVDITWPVT